jgi:hypothetical protein
MKFLLRCLLVLGIATVLGALLYYTVQALPGATPRPGARLETQNGNNVTNPGPRPERPENNRNDGPRLRSMVGVIGKTILFSVLVFAAVIGKNFIFERKLGRKSLGD